jgi:hypothetical protein
VTRIGHQLFLAIVLVVATTAFAQAQRWEYASLVSTSSVLFVRLPDFEVAASGDAQVAELYALLAERYGYSGPAPLPDSRELHGITEPQRFSLLGFLNVLGYGGWELVLWRSAEESHIPQVFYLKRAIP